MKRFLVFESDNNIFDGFDGAWWAFSASFDTLDEALTFRDRYDEDTAYVSVSDTQIVDLETETIVGTWARYAAVSHDDDCMIYGEWKPYTLREHAWPDEVPRERPSTEKRW